MNNEIFCIWDSAAKRFLTPFFAPTVEFAIREFRAAVNKPGHQFNQYPEDYTLFHVGTWYAETAEFNTHSPHSLGVAITYVEKKLAEQLPLLPENDNDENDAN